MTYNGIKLTILSIFLTSLIILARWNTRIKEENSMNEKRGLSSVSFSVSDQQSICTSINISSVLGSSYINAVNNITGSYLQQGIDMTNSANSGAVTIGLILVNSIEYYPECDEHFQHIFTKCFTVTDLYKATSDSLSCIPRDRNSLLYRIFYIPHFLYLSMLLLQENFGRKRLQILLDSTDNCNVVGFYCCLYCWAFLRSVRKIFFLSKLLCLKQYFNILEIS